MFRISKRFDFSASHILAGLPEGHQCGRMHGHNYTFEVELESLTLDPTGFVLDYGELKPVKEFIDLNLDHRHLNDVVDFQPSAENIAQWFHAICQGLLGAAIVAKGRRAYFEGQDPDPVATHVSAIRVYETPKTCAEYRKS